MYPCVTMYKKTPKIHLYEKHCKIEISRKIMEEIWTNSYKVSIGPLAGEDKPEVY